jgi:hypothetical protein
MLLADKIESCWIAQYHIHHIAIARHIQSICLRRTDQPTGMPVLKMKQEKNIMEDKGEK